MKKRVSVVEKTGQARILFRRQPATRCSSSIDGQDPQASTREIRMQHEGVMAGPEDDAVVGGHCSYGTGRRRGWALGAGAGEGNGPYLCKNGEVKTTVEIPDPLFRQAKAAAAQKGIPLKQLFTEALREQLRRQTPGQAHNKPWMQAFGGLRGLHKENKRLQRILGTEFEGIDEEEWH